MCGQAGIILGRKRRTDAEREYLVERFTSLLALGQSRGTDASGIATMQRDGSHRLFKRALPAVRLMDLDPFGAILDGIDYGTTLVLGHTRHGTRGSADVNENNHPIRAENVMGTHNGTIENANLLFRMLDLPRAAAVDSELIFRLGEWATRPSGKIDTKRLRRRLRLFRGTMAVVMSSRRSPELILVIKGRKPMELRIHLQRRAILYSSVAEHLRLVLDNGWRTIDVPPMTITTFRTTDLGWRSEPLRMAA